MAAEGRPFIFRINENGSGPNLLVQVCAERGWREYNEGATRDNWNLWWRSQGFPVSLYKSLKSWQFTNHIPKASSICRKDTLARFLRCMRNVYGAVYDFSPPVYNLPLEFNKLVAECSRNRLTGLEDDDVWICKPVGQSQGRGIYLFRKLSELTYDSNTIVQRYIRNPFLIGGYKFDLRLYVCVPSYHPLTVYLYREGLVRFSTDKFSLNDLNNPFCHLTNSSLNKLGPGYMEMKDRVGSGCKWTLKQLRHYLAQAGLCDWLLWQRVAAIVVLTVLAQVPSIPPTANCFEFLGFDILVDSSLRPWLLEVNLSPALGNDCDVDPAVKKPMLHDLFDLLGLPVCNTGLQLFTLWSSPEAQAANPSGAPSCAPSATPSPRMLPGGGPRGAAATGGTSSSTSPTTMRSTPGMRRGRGAHGVIPGGGNPRRSRECLMATEVAMTAVQAAMRWRRRHTLNRAAAGVDATRSRFAAMAASEDDTAEDDEASSSSMTATSMTSLGIARGARRTRRRSARRGSSSGSSMPPTAPSNSQSRGSNPGLAPVICVTALTGSSVGCRPSTPQRSGKGAGSCGGSAGCGENNGSVTRPPSPSVNVFGPHPPPVLRVTPLSVIANEVGHHMPAGSTSGGGSTPRAKSACRSASTSTGTSEEPWGRGVLPPGASRVKGRARGRCPPPTLWGNGKDWSQASSGEGGWVRIFPLGSGGGASEPMAGPAPSTTSGSVMAAGGEGIPGTSFGDTVVRRAVYDINRMLRVAREVARKYAKGSDTDRNKAMADALAFGGDPWLPLK